MWLTLSHGLRQAVLLVAGLFSMWVLREQCQGAGCRVVAVEPLPPNQQLLRANLQQAGLWSQVPSIFILQSFSMILTMQTNPKTF